MAPQEEAGPVHLVLMANGLFSCPQHWHNVQLALCLALAPQGGCTSTNKAIASWAAQQSPGSSPSVLLHASEVNARGATFDGVDRCGDRLVEEILQLAQQHPSLQHVTLMGHSLGGVLCRYAAGKLWDPSTRTLGGRLRPAHFVAIASPHAGVTSCESFARAPLVEWLGRVPLLGGCLMSVASAAAGLVAGTFFGRTGKQLLGLDGHPKGSGAKGGEGLGLAHLPMLVQLVCDDPQRGLHPWSGLEAFRTHTAYANTDGDHWITWANGSLRFEHELPRLPPEALRCAAGVVHEEGARPKALAEALARPRAGGQGEGQARGKAAAGAGAGAATAAGAGAAAASAAGAPVDAADVAISITADASTSASPSGGAAGGEGAAAAAAGPGQQGAAAHAAWPAPPEPPSPASVATPHGRLDFVLSRLQTLPWARVSVSFAGEPPLTGPAHSKIQARPRFGSRERTTTPGGEAVALHLAATLAAHIHATNTAAAAAAAEGGNTGSSGPGPSGRRTSSEQAQAAAAVQL